MSKAVSPSGSSAEVLPSRPGEAMEDAARKCEVTVLLQWPDAKAEGTPFDCCSEPVENHILWMCQQIPLLPRGKADRWLGFVQGWLWERGYASIDEMRGWNRGIDE